MAKVKNKTASEISVTRRATSSFLLAIPHQITFFDASLYIVVDRKEGKDVLGDKFGIGVRLDPVHFDWVSKSFTVHIPLNINVGIESIDDLDDEWFESVQASFILFMVNSL